MKNRGEQEVARIHPVFVDTIPAAARDLQAGNLYISMKYNTLVHRCPCGCGGLSEIGLHPATRRMIYDGENVSIEPSIGARSLPCRSHYWITKNRILWAGALGVESDERYDRRRVGLTETYMERLSAHKENDGEERWWSVLLRKAKTWLGW